MNKIKTILIGIAVFLILLFVYNLWQSSHNGKIKVGMKAPDFISYNTNGESVSLANYKNKILFIDFWASWCGPCRKNNPFIRSLRNIYANDTTLAFMMISLDTDKMRWLHAIEKDSLSNFIHLSQLKSWEEPAALALGVNSIPFNILINKDGYIIGKNLDERSLQLLLKKNK